MIRLFKHYVPNAVLLLGLLDIILLLAAAELGWVIRAHQIDMAVEPIVHRLPQLASFALSLELAMVAVGVYGADALQSLRFATARLLVAVRSEEHTSELQSLMRISYAVFCLKKKNNK